MEWKVYVDVVGASQELICSWSLSFPPVRGTYRWSEGGEENNYNETNINAESPFLSVSFSFSFTEGVWRCVLEKNTICLLQNQYQRTQFTILLQSGCDKKTFIVVFYNLPAHHKLNLSCFLWLTKEHKFNGPWTKAFHSPCNRQYINPISHMTGSYCGWQTRLVLSDKVRWSGFSFTAQGNNRVN